MLQTERAKRRLCVCVCVYKLSTFMTDTLAEESGASVGGTLTPCVLGETLQDKVGLQQNTLVAAAPLSFPL